MRVKPLQVSTPEHELNAVFAKERTAVSCQLVVFIDATGRMTLVLAWHYAKKRTNLRLKSERNDSMRLTDGQIEQYLAEGMIAIEPAPDSKDITGVTVDIHLGDSFRVLQDHAAPYN